MQTCAYVKARPAQCPRISNGELLEELRRVARLVGGSLLHEHQFMRHSKRSASTYLRRFGSWRTALALAGLPGLYAGPDSGRHLEGQAMTEEMLLDEVRRAARLAGKPVLSTPDFDTHSKVAVGTVRHTLGSWNEALERAGLGHMRFRMDNEAARAYRAKHSDEELREEIRRVAQLVGKPFLTKQDFVKYSKIGTTTFRERFGSWKNALEIAGVGQMFAGNGGERMRERVNQDELLNEVRRVAALVEGRMPTMFDFIKHSETPFRGVRQLGGWRKALHLAGVDRSCESWGRRGPCKSRGQSREDLLEEVRRVAAQVNKRTLTFPDFVRNSEVGIYPIEREFGTWRQALEAAGLSKAFAKSAPPAHPAPAGPSDEELLAEVRRVAALMPTPVLPTPEFIKHSEVSPSTLRRRFGGWKEALELAGVGEMYGGSGRALAKRYSRSDEELLEDVRRVASLMGKRELTKRDFLRHSDISVETLMRRFGGWKEAFPNAPE